MRILIAALALWGIGCGHAEFSSPDPVNEQEAFFIAKVEHYCGVLEHGPCYVEFHENPNGGWMAAWATPGGNVVNAHRQTIHDGSFSYLNELAGHEVCHLGGCKEKYGRPGCWTEVEANECVNRIVYGQE